MILYAAAALPAPVWDRLERLSILETGKRVWMTSAWGSTETAPQVTIVHFESVRTSVVGLPSPGYELKMVPVDTAGKYELRVRGSNVTPGYWKRDDLTAAAFDEHGFYKMGDAGRFADPDDPSKGIEFAGLAEDFKLTSATWVHVGALRVRAIAALAPIALDVVIAGHDRDEVGFLVFPKPDTAALDPQVRECLQRGMIALSNEGGGGTTYATRAILLEEPPSIDAGEITDKGYINQRAVLERRAASVERLYAQPCDDSVIVL